MGLTSGTRPMAAATPHRPATLYPGQRGRGGYTLTTKDNTVLGYDASGKQTSFKDRNCCHAILYNARRPAHEIIDPENQQVTIAYTGSWPPVSPTRPAAPPAGHDGSNRLTVITDPDTNAYHYAYDARPSASMPSPTPTPTPRVSATPTRRLSSITRPGTTAESLNAGPAAGGARGRLWHVVQPGAGRSWRSTPRRLRGRRQQHLDHLRGLVGFGTGAEYVDGTSYLSLTYRDTAALPWLDTDNLADRKPHLLRQPGQPHQDGPARRQLHHETFDSIFNEVTQYTDENGDSPAMAWIPTAT